MYHTPKHLWDVTLQQQSDAPYFGLGFCKTTLDAAIYQKIVDHFSKQKDSFHIEHDMSPSQ